MFAIDKGLEASAPLTLVFTDMVGSSAAKRASDLGADADTRDSAYLDAVQTRHLRLVRKAVAAHGGKEIMTIGDAFFLTFEDARSAVLCAAEIQMRLKNSPIMTSAGPLKLRIGIHVGRPKFFENSWHGTDVDTAARAESAGSPDQIVLTETARHHIGDMSGIKLRPLGTFALKGVGNIPLWDADYDNHGPRKPQLASLESIRGQRRSKLLWRAGYVALAAVLILGCLFIYKRQQKTVFTEKDKIILADFDNKTGDPVFDATLKEALSIQLEQSPVLQLVGDEELHADLRYLNQPTEQRITPALAREIGQREGIKAYIAASVANIGTSYVVSIDALNCATGDAIARAQAESPDKNHVLSALSTAATALRAKLGESLASVQKLSTPYMDVTTSSLEAFHAYSLGEDAHRRGADPEALVFYKQATDLDPNFAMAYARTGVVYNNFGQVGKAIEFMTKAFDLRQHATERERLYITAQLASSRGDFPATISAYEALLGSYPNDPAGLNNIGIIYGNEGDLEKAIGYYRKVADEQPWDVASIDNANGVLLQVGDLPAAKKYMDTSISVGKGTDTQLIVNQALYQLETGNPAWKNSSNAAVSRPDAFLLYQALSDVYYMHGALAQGRAMADRGATSAMQAKAPDAAGNVLSVAALMEAEFGECSQVPSVAHKALALDASIQTLPDAALALALCGQGGPELASLRKLALAAPDNTLLNEIYLPEVEATVAKQNSQIVISTLERTHTYAFASISPILEARALLTLHRPSDALTILAPALRYRFGETQIGPGGQIPSFGVASLLAARAYAMDNDKPNATKMYQQTIDIWKEADPNFKPLADAKKELAALQ